MKSTRKMFALVLVLVMCLAGALSKARKLFN